VSLITHSHGAELDCPCKYRLQAIISTLPMYISYGQRQCISASLHFVSRNQSPLDNQLVWLRFGTPRYRGILTLYCIAAVSCCRELSVLNVSHSQANNTLTTDVYPLCSSTFVFHSIIPKLPTSNHFQCLHHSHRPIIIYCILSWSALKTSVRFSLFFAFNLIFHLH